MGEAWRFASHNLRHLLTSPRLYLSLFAVCAYLWIFYGNIGSYLVEAGESLQGFELMIFTAEDRFTKRMVVFGAMLLLGDAPFLHDGLSVYLIRSNRRNWFLGQVLYCLIATVLYLVLIELMYIPLYKGHVFFQNHWSETADFASYVGIGSVVDPRVNVPFSRKIILCGGPWLMFGLTILYNALFLMTLSMLCLAMNAKWRVGVGWVGVAIYLIISPFDLATLGKETISPASLAYRASFFLCVCLVLGIWGYHTLRRADLGGSSL